MTVENVSITRKSMMDQKQPRISEATPRQIAGVSARLAASLVLVFAGVLVASVPFMMQFAKKCPDIDLHLLHGRTITDQFYDCSDGIAGAIRTFNSPGWEFIGSVALLMAMVGILRRRRQQIAARREME